MGMIPCADEVDEMERRKKQQMPTEEEFNDLKKVVMLQSKLIAEIANALDIHELDGPHYMDVHELEDLTKNLEKAK